MYCWVICIPEELRLRKGLGSYLEHTSSLCKAYEDNLANLQLSLQQHSPRVSQLQVINIARWIMLLAYFLITLLKDTMNAKLFLQNH